MNMMKRWLCAALAACSLMPLAGCGDTMTNEGEVTLRIWSSQDDQSMIREMCEAFAAADPETKYTFQYGVVGEGDAKKMFLDDPAAAADVFHFANDQLPDLVTAGALAQIGGTYRETVESSNGEGSVNAAKVGDKLYAFPATADNGYFLYYDKRKFAAPPQSLTEILDACEDGEHFAMKLSDGWYAASFFLTAGCEFEEDKTVDWDNENGLAAAQAMNALAKDDRFLHFGADFDSSMISGFGDGSVIAAVSGSWTAEKIASEIGEENLGATKLPTIEIGGEERQMRGFAGYKLVGVNASAKSPEAAVRLAAWLTNEENQMRRFTLRGAGPSNTKIAESDAVKENLVLSALAIQLGYSVSQNNVPASYWAAAEGFGTDLVSSDVPDSELPQMLTSLVNVINTPVG